MAALNDLGGRLVFGGKPAGGRRLVSLWVRPGTVLSPATRYLGDWLSPKTVETRVWADIRNLVGRLQSDRFTHALPKQSNLTRESGVFVVELN